MSKYQILLTPGDGIGPEVLEEALKVLGRIENRFGHEFQYETEIPSAVPPSTPTESPSGTKRSTRPSPPAPSSSAPLVALNGTTHKPPSARSRPSLACEKGLGLFANLRPVAINSRHGRRQHPQAGGAGRHRHDHRPRTYRRHLLRQAPEALEEFSWPPGRRHPSLQREGDHGASSTLASSSPRDAARS